MLNATSTAQVNLRNDSRARLGFFLESSAAINGFISRYYPQSSQGRLSWTDLCTVDSLNNAADAMFSFSVCLTCRQLDVDCSDWIGGDSAVITENTTQCLAATSGKLCPPAGTCIRNKMPASAWEIPGPFWWKGIRCLSFSPPHIFPPFGACSHVILGIGSKQKDGTGAAPFTNVDGMLQLSQVVLCI